MRKKMTAIAMTLVMTVGMLAGCGVSGGTESAAGTEKASAEKSEEGSAEKTQIKIAAAMPTTGNARFVTDGKIFKSYCEEKGYQYTDQFAENDVATQIQQIEGFISGGYDAIIVCPVDGAGVSSAVKKARDAGIKIVSFDRMVMDTEVDYYATFDNVGVGTKDAEYIVEKLDLDNTSDNKTYNVEIFTGDIADNNALLGYQGAMEVLQPYIDSGKVVVKSGQTEYEQVVTTGWDSGEAQKRMENLLSSYYQDEKVDAVLTTYANLALGCITALKSAGYGTDDKPLPITTSQDAEIAACKSILAGELSMSILKDDRMLCPIAIDMAVAAVKGEEYQVNDTETYDNGTGPLKTYKGEITTFDIDNFKEVVYDSGFLTEEDLQ
ncbi:substrate-binding domain-containing protein [Ruminococcus gauvreauii]|uniref:substrate-binding domain-containing protein n=1 Tax=Ruminococcus gauvreauii TaxID=438033 RepID=UPI003984410F